MSIEGLRPVVAADIEILARLNNAAVPAVTPADEAHMARLVAAAALAWAVERHDDLVAFVLLFGPGADYDSPNYGWFCDRYDDFLYVDRIVVADGARGSGLGALLYDEVAAEAGRRGAPAVAAEVNLVPPNPGSSRFHRRAGFEQVGVQRLGAEYEVEMLLRPVAPG